MMFLVIAGHLGYYLEQNDLIKILSVQIKMETWNFDFSLMEIQEKTKSNINLWKMKINNDYFI